MELSEFTKSQLISEKAEKRMEIKFDNNWIRFPMYLKSKSK